MRIGAQSQAASYGQGDRGLHEPCEARRDLIAITNVLKGKTEEEKLSIFGDEHFMKKWVRGVRTVLVYWDNKIKMMNE